MMSRVTRVDPLKRIESTCSFCGKDHMQVPEIVAGPTVFICSSCIDLCNDVLQDRYTLLHEAIRHALQQMRAACEVQEKIAFDQAVSTLRAHLKRIRNRFDAQELRWERMLLTCLQDAVAYTPMSRINPDMVNRLLELFLGVITITRSNPQRSDVSELSFRLQAAGFDLFPTS